MQNQQLKIFMDHPDDIVEYLDEPVFLNGKGSKVELRIQRLVNAFLDAFEVMLESQEINAICKALIESKMLVDDPFGDLDGRSISEFERDFFSKFGTKDLEKMNAFVQINPYFSSLLKDLFKVECGIQLLLNDGKNEMPPTLTQLFEEALDSVDDDYAKELLKLQSFLKSSIKKGFLKDVGPKFIKTYVNRTKRGDFFCCNITEIAITKYLYSHLSKHRRSECTGISDKTFYTEIAKFLQALYKIKYLKAININAESLRKEINRSKPGIKSIKRRQTTFNRADIMRVPEIFRISLTSQN